MKGNDIKSFYEVFCYIEKILATKEGIRISCEKSSKLQANTHWKCYVKKLI